MKLVLSIIITTLILSLNVFSQLNILTEYEHDSKVSTARKTFYSKDKIRRTSITRVHKDNVANITEKNVYEEETENKIRTINYSLVDGQLKILYEQIRIDGKLFNHRGDGKWALTNTLILSSPSLQSTPSKQMSQYYSVDTTYKEQKVMAYNSYTVTEYNGKLTFLDETSFLDENNKIVYSKIIISNIHPGNITQSTENIYEYNLDNLKIEIPSKYKVEKK